MKEDTDWSALEEALLADCRMGGGAVLPGNNDLSKDTGDPDRRVRAGLYLHRLSTWRDVHLSRGFSSGARVDLGRAQIGGQFAAPKGPAFFQSSSWIITAPAAAVLTGPVGRRD